MRPIVLVHGGGQGGWIWDETISALRAQAGERLGNVVALDVPGCGTKRDRETTGLGVPEVVAELAAELAARAIRDALLVGHSQAGTLLPGLIAACPGRIARAVYFTCCAPLEGQTVHALIGRGVRGASDTEIGWPLDPAAVTQRALFGAAFCSDMDEIEREAFLDRLGKDAWPGDCMLTSNRWSYEAARRVPATYVIALRDNILPVEWQARAAALVHAVSIVRLDCGHQGMNTRPHALAEILLAEARLPGPSR